MIQEVRLFLQNQAIRKYLLNNPHQSLLMINLKTKKDKVHLKILLQLDNLKTQKATIVRVLIFLNNIHQMNNRSPN